MKLSIKTRRGRVPAIRMTSRVARANVLGCARARRRGRRRDREQRGAGDVRSTDRSGKKNEIRTGQGINEGKNLRIKKNARRKGS